MTLLCTFYKINDKRIDKSESNGKMLISLKNKIDVIS